MRAGRFTYLLLLASLAFALPSDGRSASAADSAALSRPAVDRWYRLSLRGEDAGWTHEESRHDSVEAETSESLLRVERLGTAINLYSRSRVTRDARGRVTLGYLATSAPGETLDLRVTFAHDSLRIERHSAGLRSSEALPRPPDCLDPIAIEARYDSARARMGQPLRFRCYWPELERFVAVSLSAEASDTLTLAKGKRRDCTRYRMSTDELGGMGTVEWRDADGVTLRTREDALGLVAELSTREACLAPSAPADLMRQLSIPLSRSFATSGHYDRVRYRIRGVDPDALGELKVLAPAKRVAAEDSMITIEVLDAFHGPRDRTAPEPNDLAPSPILQADAPEMVEVARREAGQGSAWERSERLCHFVARHVRSKDLSIGFASALATLKSGEGDCTEHAVLLAALARADGIPSRVKAGLLALGAEMGFHLWTEVWNGEAWIGLDATFDRAPVDGRYLPISVSDLSTGSVADLARGILPWIGRVRIEADVP